MKNKLLPVLLIIAIIIVAGCTSGGVSGAAAINIKSFGPTRQGTQDRPVKPGGSVRIEAVFENVGGADAKGLKATLFGLDDKWSITREQQFDINSGKEVKKIWVATAASTPIGIKEVIPYDIEIRAQYTYSTTAVSVYTYAYGKYLDGIENDQERQNEMNRLGLKTQVSSIGPVSVSMTGNFPNDAIVEPDTPAIVKISLQNNGNGFPVSSEVRVEKLEGVSNCDEPDFKSGGEIILDSGKSFETTCDVVPGGESDQPVSTPKRILVGVSYEYYTYATSKVYYSEGTR